MKRGTIGKIVSLCLMIALCLSVFAGCKSMDEPISGPADTANEETKKENDTAKKEEKEAKEEKKQEASEKQAEKPAEEPKESNATASSDEKKDGQKTEETKVVSASDVYAPVPDEYGILKYEDGYTYENKKTELELEFKEDGTYKFEQKSTFYTTDITLKIKAPKGAEIYYTLDGSTPTKDSTRYEEKLSFEAGSSEFPKAYILRAKAFLKDGTESQMAARSYLVGSKLDGRWSTVIFSVSGDPKDLTQKPSGIFTGSNYKERGRESERPVYVEAWEPDGKQILSQYAGVRVYGGYSRQYSIKSMKLFARKSYDAENGKFKFDLFDTKNLATGETIKKYDKLVLRDCGNDLQFTYIRDELSQTLARLAGFDCYEAVIPAVGYLNGEYYGFYWLHENYCDEYFKQRFGDADGEFIILEGSEAKKDKDEDLNEFVDDFNDFYDEIIKEDLTDDAVYAKLTAFMDVEDYLAYYAWNIALGNFDWPNNNFKCYRYVPKDGVSYGDGVYDGRYRFLLHDMDYAYGLYDQSETQAKYNTLKTVLNSKQNRYAPLFAKLMYRADAREYFMTKTYEFTRGVLSPEVLVSVYEELHKSREYELAYYYEHLQQLSRKGDFSIWSNSSHYSNYEKQIKDFAAKRASYVEKYMEQILSQY